uniref:Uncharacterized protein n=1 Tax=Ignisphaera aggregans TaxID=334771 RepID=A0A7C4H7P6_9CREN
MITIRLMYSEKNEKKEALKLAKYLVKMLEKKGYNVKSNSKIYRNKKNNGGRIYISLEKKN